jgi:hypothetical protein
MPYCTATDVHLEAGSAVGTAVDADITNMIVRSDAEISDILTSRGLSVPTSSSLLTTASIALTIAKIKRRQAHELSRPNSLSLGGDISFSVNGETEAQACEARANRAIEQYFTLVGGRIHVSSTTGGH